MNSAPGIPLSELITEKHPTSNPTYEEAGRLECVVSQQYEHGDLLQFWVGVEAGNHVVLADLELRVVALARATYTYINTYMNKLITYHLYSNTMQVLCYHHIFMK